MERSAHYKKKSIKFGVALLCIMCVGLVAWKHRDSANNEQENHIALSPLTICEALRKATEKAGVNYDALRSINMQQKTFIAFDYTPYVEGNMGKAFSPDELKSFASHDYQELNKILRDNGFSIQLNAFPPRDFGVVAIQDVLVKWIKEGTTLSLKAANSKEYEGVFIKQEDAGISEGVLAGSLTVNFLAGDDDDIVVVQLPTQSQDIVYCVVSKSGDAFADLSDDAAIANAINNYRENVQKYDSANDAYGAVHFPMISYDVRPDISWLLGMKIGTFEIAQALQQVIFKMNEKGARAKAAVAIGMEMTAMPRYKPTLEIDTPFLLWIERPGVALPIFAGYMTYGYWKNPGEL